MTDGSGPDSSVNRIDDRAGDDALAGAPRVEVGPVGDSGTVTRGRT